VRSRSCAGRTRSSRRRRLSSRGSSTRDRRGSGLHRRAPPATHPLMVWCGESSRSERCCRSLPPPTTQRGPGRPRRVDAGRVVRWRWSCVSVRTLLLSDRPRKQLPDCRNVVSVSTHIHLKERLTCPQRPFRPPAPTAPAAPHGPWRPPRSAHPHSAPAPLGLAAPRSGCCRHFSLRWSPSWAWG
jgi:hypothetical protein